MSAPQVVGWQDRQGLQARRPSSFHRSTQTGTPLRARAGCLHSGGMLAGLQLQDGVFSSTSVNDADGNLLTCQRAWITTNACITPFYGSNRLPHQLSFVALVRRHRPGHRHGPVGLIFRCWSRCFIIAVGTRPVCVEAAKGPRREADFVPYGDDPIWEQVMGSPVLGRYDRVCVDGGGCEPSRFCCQGTPSLAGKDW